MTNLNVIFLALNVPKVELQEGSHQSKKASSRDIGKRQILPAYARGGVVFEKVYDGSTDKLFEAFIEELLQSCGRFPAPKSILITDNFSFHHSKKRQRMCEEAGVKLLFLHIRTDINRIEDFFSDLTLLIPKH